MRGAADKGYGPAMFEEGRQYFEGRLLPKDEKKGFSSIEMAAERGSTQAQYLLGGLLEQGERVEKNLKQAAQSFRLCAAQNFGPCQYRLGRLLADGVEGKAGRGTEAAAWLELAEEGGVEGARAALDEVRARLKPGDEKSVKSLKSQLLQR